MTISVVGFGAGGHARVVIEILRSYSDFKIVGLLEKDVNLHGKEIFGIPILGTDDQLNKIIDSGVRHFFIGVGSVGDYSQRRALFEHAKGNGLTAVNAIHPSAVISESATFGEGLAMMAGAIINSGVKIGLNVILNTGSIVEHDCILGDHVHIAPRAVLSGGVIVGTNAHIGIGATVKEGIRIGDGAIVGAGAVVLTDIPSNTVVVGVPARILRSTKPSVEP